MTYSQANSSEHRIKKEEQGPPLFLTLRKPTPNLFVSQWSTLPKFLSRAVENLRVSFLLRVAGPGLAKPVVVSGGRCFRRLLSPCQDERKLVPPRILRLE